MTKVQEQLVKQTLSVAAATQELTVDKINETAPKPVELETAPLSIKERAKLENVRYVEPKKKLPALGKLPEKLQKQHAYDWEYVKGVYRHEGASGQYMSEPMEFWFVKYPGDQDCLWSVPVGVPCYVPRMVAKHLSGERDEVTGIEVMKYHSFDYKQRPDSLWRKDDFTHDFSVIATHYRGKFSPMGAFN